jgi:hypothetical protein
MAEALPIQSQGTQDVASPEAITPEVMASPAKDTSIQVTTIENAPSLDAMIQDTTKHYVKTMFDNLKLEMNTTNYEKIVGNLHTKILEWITAGDTILEEIDSKEFASKFFENACKRKGLDNTAANWKQIAKDLKLV